MMYHSTQQRMMSSPNNTIPLHHNYVHVCVGACISEHACTSVHLCVSVLVHVRVVVCMHMCLAVFVCV